MQIPVKRTSLTATGKVLAMLEPNANKCITTSSRFNCLEGLSSTSSSGSCFFGKLGLFLLFSIDDAYAKAIQMILKDVKTVSDLMDLDPSGFQVMDYVI